jgi:hypothetical protein
MLIILAIVNIASWKALRVPLKGLNRFLEKFSWFSRTFEETYLQFGSHREGQRSQPQNNLQDYRRTEKFVPSIVESS